jgi:ubiquitin-conjugating enzyme E2 variant
MIMIVLKIFGLILLTDLLTGSVHWWEDAYGNPKWKILGKSVVIPNLEHHQYPRKFLKTSMWPRIRLSLFAAFGLGVIAYFLGILIWEVAFVLLYASLANEIHAIAHRTDKENGKLICWIQKTGLIQSRRMHGHHHTSPYDINYCVMTNYLNPVLNKIKFWDGIEYIVGLFGIKPTRGLPSRGGY